MSGPKDQRWVLLIAKGVGRRLLPAADLRGGEKGEGEVEVIHDPHLLIPGGFGTMADDDGELLASHRENQVVPQGVTSSAEIGVGVYYVQ